MRLRAFGNYSFRIADAKLFHTEISGTREIYTVADSTASCAACCCRTSATRSRDSGVPFLDLAANQIQFAEALATQLVPAFASIGLKLERHDGAEPVAARRAAEDPRPEDRHGHGRQRHGQVHAVPDRAGDSRNWPRARAAVAASPAMRWGWAPASRMGQVLAQNLRRGCRRGAAAAQQQPAVAVVKPDDVMATLEKLGELKAKGILTQEEFDAKKAELLKKLV